MFYREEKKVPLAKKPVGFKNLEPIESFEVLINDKKRQEALQQIKHNLAYQASHYQKLVSPLVANVALYLQHLPATSLYFSQRGGLLNHALYRTEAALNLMRQLMVQDASGIPSESQKTWLYALFSASLLRGIGKLYTEYQINIHNSMGTFVKNWEPLLEDMPTVGDYYCYQFVREDKDSERLRPHITVLLAQQLMPKEGFALLTAHPPIFKAWLALLEEDRDGAGYLAAILDRAEAFAAQRYLHHYLEEHDYILEQGHGRVGSFLDAVPENTMERERVIGAKFLVWIHDALETGQLILNKEPFHAEIYPTGAVLTAEVYDMFLQEHLKLKSKYMIQRAVSAWHTHQKLDQSDATKDNQTLSKLHLDNVNLPESIKVYDQKSGRISTVSTLNLVYDMEAYSRDYSRIPAVIQQLDTSGNWVAKEEAAAQHYPMGTKVRG